ncbi:hypothetical protein M0802_000380 [Mischocyttarus mexicanus]|nr:hypothetical protein M0802_000380 [Mischocyttarus mexicanus]
MGSEERRRVPFQRKSICCRSRRGWSRSCPGYTPIAWLGQLSVQLLLLPLLGAAVGNGQLYTIDRYHYVKEMAIADILFKLLNEIIIPVILRFYYAIRGLILNIDKTIVIVQQWKSNRTYVGIYILKQDVPKGLTHTSEAYRRDRNFKSVVAVISFQDVYGPHLVSRSHDS